MPKYEEKGSKDDDKKKKAKGPALPFHLKPRSLKEHKTMAAIRAAAPRGLRRLFSTSTFIPPPVPKATQAPAAAEPSPNLFISGLSKRTTSEGLREAFAKYGEVVHARVVTDRVSGYSKGFGFVRYATTEEAAAGIQGMDGKFLDGWVIFAEYARPRPLPGTPSNTGASQSGSPYGAYVSYSQQ
ncbi:Organelle RRM domain-containing protein 2, mitochondrial [Ancistrocladus abbreviatus]